MNLFGPVDAQPDFEPSEQYLAEILGRIKRDSRNRRIAMIAPVALAAAVLATLMAAPPRYGGLALVPDAEASAGTQLPRVFGSNGVWRLAEPITEGPLGDPGPASVVEAPTALSAPEFVLSPPEQADLQSLPVSTSTPPTSTPGQSTDQASEAGSADSGETRSSDDAAPGELDWSSFAAVIRVDRAGDDERATPASPATAGDPTSPDPSSAGEDVTVAVEPQSEPSGQAVSSAPDLGSRPEANPSTPLAGSTTAGALSSAMATIVPRSVLVYSAHVSVTVQVVDDDSSVIDWCNTRVDWGDGSVTRVAGTDGVAPCAASCEHEATPSVVGVNAEIEFTHEYAAVIDAAPRIYVATGDGCNYTLAELQLNPFTVVPY